MRIQKTSRQPAGSGLLPGHLEDINRLSRASLSAQEVYAFSLCLCDNEVDRDQERFPEKTLEQLAPLFVGKSGLFDHSWSARGQAARLYRTEVVREPERLTQAGDGYCWLKGWAYMVRTPDNQSLIAEIEGGIKKEVSVGCAVERAVCAICGAERGQDCGHKPGEIYDGARCFFELEEAVDAYELAAGRDWCIRELDGLEREAALGRKWLSSLREEVVRLGALANGGLDRTVQKQIVNKLDVEELQALKEVYQARAREHYPLPVQLEYAQKPEEDPREDGAFLI